MKYSGSLVKRERAEIFKLFLTAQRLKFSEIEKQLSIRSNMVAYHLMSMVKEGLLLKKGDSYELTAQAEKYIPIFSHVTGSETSPLPVVLVAVFHKKNILLIERVKRPYKGYLSLIGGKMLMEEDIVRASIRHVQEKTGLEASFVSTNAILQEHVYDAASGSVKHSFILFFVRAVVASEEVRESPHGPLKWFTPKEFAELRNVIPSDWWLLKNKLGSQIDMDTARMVDDQGTLKDFRMLS